MRAAPGHPLNAQHLLTPSDVRVLLDRHGLAPRRADGQNFLVDPNTVRRIVAAAGLDGDDVVLEVGPGLGSLTSGLVGHVARIIAVELDAGLVAVLRERFADRDDVEVIHADVLDLDLDEVVVADTVRLVANLPYNAATPIVMQALASRSVTDALVMVQREVGERWAAPVGHRLRSAVSVKIELEAHAHTALRIPRAVFHPVPNVDSVMIRLARRDDAPTGAERTAVFALVEAAFAQRRKTLRNTLSRHTDRERLEAVAADLGVDLGWRAEQLPAVTFRQLAAALAPDGGTPVG
ncbi:MAG: 16S rRNA (adenine(1518)-N(6)/adenine(1519)-N(6))-dimethyltransferase RsmA [Nitriliruptoraceae bacterium]